MLFWESKLIHCLLEKAMVPKLYFVGDDTSDPNQHFHVMIMDQLGPSLEDLCEQGKKPFDLKTTLMIGMQMISIA